jgi:H+-translocating NAD(P) transhydrogenase subunit beta
MTTTLVDLAYLVAAVLFIFGIKRLQSPQTARSGNQIAAVGMLIAVIATLFLHRIITPVEMILGLAVGAIIGAVLARKVKMTAMPELVAVFNGFGGLASALVAAAEVLRYLVVQQPSLIVDAAQLTQTDVAGFGPVTAFTVFISVLVGAVTFSGSFIAFGKLGGHISGNPVSFPGMRILTALIAIGALVAAVFMMIGAATFPADPDPVIWGLAGLALLALVLGVLLVIPIGGADMPVVVALLNSYSGLAAAATGFVLDNTALIVSGALVGAAGFILTMIMCEAMNRSLLNVLLGGFGIGDDAGGSAVVGLPEGKSIVEATADDVAILLAYAQSVVIVPGYGMAVAQAQHAVRELADMLQGRGVRVRYAIHPVAGRMPGHMNVLLAEANVPYDHLYEMDDINHDFPTTDVSLIIGANDVVNPAARTDTSSPIYGMPILNVDQSKTVVVLKRSMRPGYSGIENELFYKSNTRMLFGDARESIVRLAQEVKAL